MSSPPDRSWMLATLIASSAKAGDANTPAAAAAALLCRNFLRFTFIDPTPLFSKTSSDQVFPQDRCAHGAAKDLVHRDTQKGPAVLTMVSNLFPVFRIML